MVVAALLTTPLAGAALIGVNDDAAKDPAQVGWFYPALAGEGLTESTLTLRWDEGAPTAIPDQAAVTRAIAAATANGASVELDLFPLHSMAFTGGAKCASTTDPQGCGNTAQIQSFAVWAGQVAAAFPTVHQYVVMNECNQPLFVNPQFDATGANQSAQICGRALAAAYDALKGVSSQNVVWGVGLSPRGNDNPNAASNVSTSPTKFLADLGAWYKASGRTRPLMDGLDFHPYPIPQSLPFATGYAGATSASVSNLPRIYQAFYDAFNGSPQRTIGQQAGGGLPVSLNEVGIQTDSTGKPGYVGTETAANAAGGVLGATATEDYQSSWYSQMLQYVACDPNIARVDLYHLLDEPALSGWQSGLFYVDHTPKASAAMVHDWVASTGGACQGASHPWTPPGVAAASTPPPAAVVSRAHIVVASAGRIRIFDASSHVLRRVLAPFGTAYTGAISLALGDVNHDGVSDIAAGQGPVGQGPQRQVGRDARDLRDLVQARCLRRARRRERRRARRPRGRIGRGRAGPGEGLRREDPQAARDTDPVRRGLQRRRLRRRRRPERRRQGRRDRRHRAGSQGAGRRVQRRDEHAPRDAHARSRRRSRAASRWPRPTRIGTERPTSSRRPEAARRA